MPAAPLTLSLLLAVGGVSGAVAMVIDSGPFAPSTGLLLVAGMSVVTAIAVSGTLLARGRWSRPVSAALAAVWIAVGATLDSPSGAVAAVIAAAAITVAAGPWLGRWLRHMPSMDGPPPWAVVGLLSLVAAPIAVALGFPKGVPPAGWGFAGWALVLALAIARTVAGALWSARILHPVAMALFFALEGWQALPAILAAAPAVAAVWRREVRLAIAPAGDRAGLRIPPELTPPDVLASAGLDETGRPLEAP